MSTYNELQFKLRQASNNLEAHRERAEKHKAGIGAANSAVAGLGAEYGAVVAEIDTQAAANLGDAVWQRLKEDKDKIVADFNTIQTTLQSAVDALTPIDI